MKKRLRHITRVNPLSRHFDRLVDDDLIPFLPMENIWPGDKLDLGLVRPKSAVSVGYTRFESGDVVVPKITPTFEASRSVLIPDLPDSVGVGTTEIHVVRPSPAIDPRYLLYVFHGHDFLRHGEASMYGVAGQKRVPDEVIKDWTIDLPLLQEQRRIADCLDAEMIRIESLISTQGRVRRILLERRAAKVFRAVTGGEIDSSAELHPKGTVVLCRTASVGYSAVMGEDMATSQDFVTWTCGPQLDPFYLLWCMRAMRSDLLGRLAMGSTHKTIYVPDLQALRVPLPPLNDQHRIVTNIRTSNAGIDAAIDAIDRQTALLAERRQALITAAVTGQIDVTTARGAEA